MKTIGKLLEKADSPLSKLINKCKASQKLAVIFSTAINPDLAPYCRFANYQDSILTISVPNSSIATKLRYAIPDIMKNLKVQSEFRTIKTIRYSLASLGLELKVKKKQPKLHKLSHSNELLWKSTIAELQRKRKKIRKQKLFIEK